MNNIYEISLKNPKNLTSAELHTLCNHYMSSHKWSSNKNGFDLMKGKPIPFSSEYVSSVVGIIDYIGQLIEDSDDLMQLEGVFKKPVDEYTLTPSNQIRWANMNGILCQYVSALTCMLLTEVFKTDGISADVQLCQGLFRLKQRQELTDLPIQIYGEYQLGCHAWILLDGHILDLTSAGSQGFVFKFDNPLGVIGMCPDGFELYGFKEHKFVVDSYIKRYAEAVGMSVYEFKLFHKMQAYERILNALETQLEAYDVILENQKKQL